jgi:PHD/YefM family antitoxin component YafN of YafNO toxin-antitoxin module
MKIVTLQQLEADFEAIVDDVAENKEHYRIEHDNGAVMLIPIESYDVLKEVYTDWVEEPQNIPPVEGFDPHQLPVVAYVPDQDLEK